MTGSSSTSDTATIFIPRRFRGPHESGNGGYTCALLARHVEAPAVEVTLRSPPPLDRPMEVRREGERALLFDGEHLLAEAAPTTLELAQPPQVSAREAIEAARRFRGYEQNPFPGCFTCGPERAAGDGLRIFAGAVAGRAERSPPRRGRPRPTSPARTASWQSPLSGPRSTARAAGCTWTTG